MYWLSFSLSQSVYSLLLLCNTGRLEWWSIAVCCVLCYCYWGLLFYILWYAFVIFINVRAESSCLSFAVIQFNCLSADTSHYYSITRLMWSGILIRGPDISRKSTEFELHKGEKILCLLRILKIVNKSIKYHGVSVDHG